MAGQPAEEAEKCGLRSIEMAPGAAQPSANAPMCCMSRPKRCHVPRCLDLLRKRSASYRNRRNLDMYDHKHQECGRWGTKHKPRRLLASPLRARVRRRGRIEYRPDTVDHRTTPTLPVTRCPKLPQVAGRPPLQAVRAVRPAKLVPSRN